MARAEKLRAAGYEVEFEPMGPEALRGLRQAPPTAVVIDFTRLPSHGREVALAIRAQKATRRVPLLIVEGEPDKVARMRQLLPDAVYTSWSRIRGALKQAIAHPPVVQVVPKSALDAYSGTPLPKKLGIKPGVKVALVGAPAGFESTLGALPEGATVRRQARGRPDVTLWFVRSRRQLERDVRHMLPFAAQGGLWIVWPKRASGLGTDVSETEVRRIGLAAGLVDYKICAVDATWSGLKFSRRKAK